MPTVLRIGPFRFFFYSNEGEEPAHIHVERDDSECKFWLDPIVLSYNKGMKRSDIKKIEKIIFENHTKLIESYNEFFSGK